MIHKNIHIWSNQYIHWHCGGPVCYTGLPLLPSSVCQRNTLLGGPVSAELLEQVQCTPDRCYSTDINILMDVKHGSVVLTLCKLY